MRKIRVGLNGFGRIGRSFTRIALLEDKFDIVAINTRTGKPEMMAYLLQNDSVYHRYSKNVKFTESSLVIDDKNITTINNDTPNTIPWDQYQTDIVVDATGAFIKKEDLMAHIHGTVKKVILTAPSKDDTTPHIVMGVNDQDFDFKNESVISNASCTTNCSAPMFKILDDNLNIISGFLTTSHAYTQTQTLLDDFGKDFERSRAAAVNIIPSTTGAAIAIVKVIPSLKGKIDGMAIRVPIPTVSFSDISAVVSKSTTVDEVNNMFQQASLQTMKDILSYEKQVLVSSDYIGSPYSCIFDSNYTKVINGNFVKIFGWYDNEWGYANRLIDLVEKLSDFV